MINPCLLGLFEYLSASLILALICPRCSVPGSFQEMSSLSRGTALIVKPVRLLVPTGSDSSGSYTFLMSKSSAPLGPPLCLWPRPGPRPTRPRPPSNQLSKCITGLSPIDGSSVSNSLILIRSLSCVNFCSFKGPI